MKCSKTRGLLVIVSFVAAGILLTSIAGAQGAFWMDLARHLDYLGYICEVKDDGQRLYCRTQKHYPNFSIKRQSGGLLLISYWSGSDYAKQNRAAFLNLVNSFNSLAIATRYYVDRDSDLALEVWMPGEYEKHSFTNAIDNFNKDWDRVQQKFGQAMLQYIR